MAAFAAIPRRDFRNFRLLSSVFINRITRLLLGWKSELMAKVWRVVYVQFIITSTVMYHAMSLDLPH
jgi:hypothetical protein